MVKKGGGQGSSRQRGETFPDAGERVTGSKVHACMFEIIAGESGEAEEDQIEKDHACHSKHFVF